MTIANSKLKQLFIGYRSQIQNFPLGTIIHSISKGNKPLFSNSAGTFCQLIDKKKNCKLRLPSGTITTIDSKHYGTIGMVSNPNFKLRVLGKAGKNRLNGIRPSVRNCNESCRSSPWRTN